MDGGSLSGEVNNQGRVLAKKRWTSGEMNEWMLHAWMAGGC